MGRHFGKRKRRLVSTIRVVLIIDEARGESGYLSMNQTREVVASASSAFFDSGSVPFQGGDFFRGELNRSTVLPTFCFRGNLVGNINFVDVVGPAPVD